MDPQKIHCNTYKLHCYIQYKVNLPLVVSYGDTFLRLFDGIHAHLFAAVVGSYLVSVASLMWTDVLVVWS